MTKPLYLSIDLGTSRIKLALIDSRGEVHDSIQLQQSLIFLEGGGVEQDPKIWEEKIKSGLSELLKRNPNHRKRICALSATAQWAGTIALDREGHLLTNCLNWMDQRGAPYIKKILGIIPTLQFIRKTGGVPSETGKEPLAHILYLLKKHPEIYEKTHKFLEPKDYLNFLFTGVMATTADTATLHWLTDTRNIENIQYNSQCLKMAGIDREKLPEIKKTGSILGQLTPYWQEEFDLPKNVQVVGGAPDFLSAAIGSGAVNDLESHVYFGTSSWITCHVPYKKTSIIHRMATLPSAIPKKYIVGNSQETAGLCLEQYNKIHFPDDPSFQKIEAAAKTAKAGSGGVIFTPWPNGENTPVDNANLRAGFYNLSMQTTREQIVRSIYEGVAYNTYWNFLGFQKFINHNVSSLNFIGGGANSLLWGQILSDVMNVEIKQVKNPEQSNNRGAAWLAAITLGHIELEDIKKFTQFSHIFTPKKENRSVYQEGHQRFLSIYRHTKKMYQSFNASPSATFRKGLKHAISRKNISSIRGNETFH